MAGFWTNFTLRNAILTVVGAFFLTQIVSLIINSIWPNVGIFRGGPILMVMLLCVAVISLFTLSLKLTELKTKENLIFIVIVFGLVAAGYYYIPQFFPQIFSISPQASESIKSTLGAIFQGGLG